MPKKKKTLTTKEIRTIIQKAKYSYRIENGTIYLPENQENWNRETEQLWLLAYHNEKDLRMKKEIRDHIIMQFYRLVQKEAYQLYNKYRSQSDPVSLEDLCQAGSYGLCVALDKYEICHEKKARFITYAKDFVKGYMRHLIRDHKIRHLSGTRGILDQHVKRFNEQIANGEEHKIDNRELVNIQNPLSFDGKAGLVDGEDQELYEFFEMVDPNNPDPFVRVELKECLEFLQKGLSEEQIWILRETKIKGRTYQDVSKTSGLAKSRIETIARSTVEQMKKRYVLWQELTKKDNIDQ